MVRLKDIIKTDNIIKISPDQTLSSALSKLTTSHDGCFVFSDEGKYLGIINPYYSIIKASFPSNSKVEHCMHHAPRIKTNTPINTVAKFFMDSKVHYLPVFDQNEKFVGIVSARHLLSNFKNSNMYRVSIKEYLKTKKIPLSTVYENDSIGQALNLYKEKKISKLIVINKDFRLRGILSYYDLIAYLISPKTVEHRGERVGNKINFYHYQVKNFSKSYVLTLKENNLMNDALELILNKKIGNVVIINDQRNPIGIITTKDLLKFFLNLTKEKKIEITLKNLSDESRRILGGFFNRFNFFLKKQPELSRVKLFVKEEKNGGLFEAVLSLFPQKGKPQVIKKEGKNIFSVLQPLSKLLKREKKD